MPPRLASGLNRQSPALGGRGLRNFSRARAEGQRRLGMQQGAAWQRGLRREASEDRARERDFGLREDALTQQATLAREGQAATTARLGQSQSFDAQKTRFLHKKGVERAKRDHKLGLEAARLKHSQGLTARKEERTYRAGESALQRGSAEKMAGGRLGSDLRAQDQRFKTDVLKSVMGGGSGSASSSKKITGLEAELAELRSPDAQFTGSGDNRIPIPEEEALARQTRASQIAKQLVSLRKEAQAQAQSPNLVGFRESSTQPSSAQPSASLTSERRESLGGQVERTPRIKEFRSDGPFEDERIVFVGERSYVVPNSIGSASAKKYVRDNNVPEFDSSRTGDASVATQDSAPVNQGSLESFTPQITADRLRGPRVGAPPTVETPRNLAAEQAPQSDVALSTSRRPGLVQSRATSNRQFVTPPSPQLGPGASLAETVKQVQATETPEAPPRSASEVRDILGTPGREGEIADLFEEATGQSALDVIRSSPRGLRIEKNFVRSLAQGLGLPEGMSKDLVIKEFEIRNGEGSYDRAVLGVALNPETRRKTKHDRSDPSLYEDRIIKELENRFYNRTTSSNPTASLIRNRNLANRK